MNVKKALIFVIILLIALCIPSVSKAADYVVALDAGHTISFEEDRLWWEKISGESWNYDKWGNVADYNNPIEGIISTSEAELTKKTVTYMMEYLKQYDNIKTIVCPRTGKGHYQDRPNYAKDNNANVHVSVHYNASIDGSKTKRGTLTIYKPEDIISKGFAETILNSVTETAGLNKVIATTDTDKNYVNNSLGIIKKSAEMNGAPSIVLEAAYFDNEDELLFLSEEANIKKIAEGTVKGILEYLGVEDKGYPEIPDYEGESNSLKSSSNSPMIITSNEDKFLGLWKNATGQYEKYFTKSGKINESALYDKDGTVVKYSSENTTVPSSILGADEWLFGYLELSERTQNHLTIMKYLMNVYTNSKDYGDIDFEKDIASIFKTSFSSLSGIYGGTIEEKVWFALRDLGYSEYAVAGVMGNIYAESGFKTASLEIGHSYEEIRNNDRLGLGLCGWTHPSVKLPLLDFAESRGVEWSDENIQVEYLAGQLNPNGGADGYAKYIFASPPSYKGYTLSDWENASSASDAAVAYCWIYERPNSAVAHLDRRKSKAEEYYNIFKGRTKSTGGGTFSESSSDKKVKGYYTRADGKKFTVLNQTTIPGWGDKCNRAACAIVASAYTNESPDELINNMNSSYNGYYFGVLPSNGAYWNKYGLEVTKTYDGSVNGKTHDYMSELKTQLSSGGYAVFWVSDGPYYGKSGIKWTSQYHWMAIIDIKNEGGVDKICIADWHGAQWVDIDEFSQRGITRIAYINPM